MSVKEKNVKLKKVNKSKWAKFKKQGLMWCLLLPTTFALFMFKIYPILNGMVLSFFHTKGFEAVEFAGFENYKNVLTDTLFIKTLGNSFMYVFWSLVIGFLPPLIFAIFLNLVFPHVGFSLI